MEQEQTNSKYSLRLKWRTKLLILFSVFSLVPSAILSYWGLRALILQSEKNTFERIEGLAKAKAQTVNQFGNDRVRQVERIATLIVPEMGIVSNAVQLSSLKDTVMVQELEDAKAIKEPGEKPSIKNKSEKDKSKNTKKDEIQNRVQTLSGQGLGSRYVKEAQESLRKTLGLILWDQEDFEELFAINTAGIVVASTFIENEGKTAANIDYFTKGKLSTYIQHVFVSPITENLTMVVATPIKDANRNTIGVLAARLNLNNFYRLIGDLTGLGKTG